MTKAEREALNNVIHEHNATALNDLRKMDEEIARKRAQLNMPLGWRVEKVKRSPAELAELAKQMAKPLTRAERAKRERDMEILRRAYELDAAACSPTPLQQRFEILMALILIWHKRKQNITI